MAAPFLPFTGNSQREWKANPEQTDFDINLIVYLHENKISVIG